MDPVGKALWYIESHFAGEISLDDVAEVAGVTRFHLARAFQTATGRPVMRYVRGRRLSEAARRLADGAPDILRVALDAGYGSHEAFTRAFRDQFGLTPEAVRARGDISNLDLMEPIRMSQTQLAPLDPPQMRTREAFLVAGLSQRFSTSATAGIPALWQSFSPHIGHVPGQRGMTCYGVCYNMDEEGNFDYMAAVEVSSFSDLPPEFSRLRIAPQTFAVFRHRDHISSIHESFKAIWNKGLPEAGLKAADAPFLEVYGPEFDPRTGTGGLEIWVPVKT